MTKIFNKDCIECMDHDIDKKTIDIIMTSPPYNTNKKATNRKINEIKTKEDAYTHVRYDAFIDNISNDEYISNSVKWFNGFDRILKENGVVLYNMSYGSENPECMYLTIAEIIKSTPFTVADTIVWKKHTATPNNMSPNKMTRIWEFVFVLCRKTEYKTFLMNKNVKSVRQNGQKNFENIYNFIEAKNNDESNNLNKSTYSTEMCEKIISMYGKEGMTVYDPFIGTGTTANACISLNMNCIGSEISKEQCWYAYKRLTDRLNEGVSVSFN